MTHRYILREKRGEITTPHINLGLFYGRRLARVAAKANGYPPQLIKKVSR